MKCSHLNQPIPIKELDCTISTVSSQTWSSDLFVFTFCWVRQRSTYNWNTNTDIYKHMLVNHQQLNFECTSTWTSVSGEWTQSPKVNISPLRCYIKTFPLVMRVCSCVCMFISKVRTHSLTHSLTQGFHKASEDFWLIFFTTLKLKVDGWWMEKQVEYVTVKQIVLNLIHLVFNLKYYCC